jgi:hypothetical protein
LSGPDSASLCEKDKLSVGVRGALSFVIFLCASKEKFKKGVLFVPLSLYFYREFFLLHKQGKSPMDFEPAGVSATNLIKIILTQNPKPFFYLCPRSL